MWTCLWCHHYSIVLHYFSVLQSQDSEDGFRTGCRNVSRQQRSFLRLESLRRSFSFKVCYSWVQTIFLKTKCILNFTLNANCDFDRFMENHTIYVHSWLHSCKKTAKQCTNMLAKRNIFLFFFVRLSPQLEFRLSAPQLINPILVHQSPTDAAPQFLSKLFPYLYYFTTKLLTVTYFQ